MGFHSSSASLSSTLSFSRTSTTSSSQYSNSSSPSSPDFTTTPHKYHIHSSPLHQLTASPAPCSSVIVPFSWEEKPGVLKKRIMQTPHRINVDIEHAAHDADCPSSPFFRHEAFDDALTYNLQPVTTQMPKSPCTSIPPIRPPPCRFHTDRIHGEQFMMLEKKAHAHRHHHCRGAGITSAAPSVGSKIMASLSLHKRRHHKSTPSLEDDPFWLAMVACTNDAAGHRSRKGGLKAFLASDISKSRTDLGLVRRVQESVHFEQCIPHEKRASKHHTISVKTHSGCIEGQEKLFAELIDDSLNSLKIAACKINHDRSQTDYVRHRHAEENVRVHSSHRRACNANLKALSMQELHKSELQQGPLVVDIACSSSRRGDGNGSGRVSAKSRGGRVASSRHCKLPDLLGCKGDYLPIMNPRFSY